MPQGRTLLRLALPAAALAILLLPSHAHAWGPLAHLDFSANALANLGAVQPSIRLLLQEFGNEFLYGSLAADIVVGKNMARYLYHCHNWRVGFNVYRAAKPGAERAFALGFLAHLSADTVAHNYYVPFKTVSSFHKASTRHAYWELRYDQKMDRSLSRLAREVSTPEIRFHDRLLARTLGGASVLPFGVSRTLFESLLASARMKRFQVLSRFALARERALPLEPDLVEETRTLATRAIVGMLRDGERCEAARADATGARNLVLASALRKKLRDGVASGRLTARDAHAIAADSRASFKKAIAGKLVLPAVEARRAA